eukprot:jgi/Bigna1/76983/fgenesh1_pg.45_\
MREAICNLRWDTCFYVPIATERQSEIYVRLENDLHLSFACLPSEQSKKVAMGKRIRWTQEEEAALVRGVKDYGAGSWARILSAHRKTFHPVRTGIHLKDKWRNLKNRGLVSGTKLIKPSPSLEEEEVTNYYEILGVSPHSCTTFDIKNAWEEYHQHNCPDIHTSEENKAKYFDVQRAVDMLSNPTSKVAYDQRLLRHFRKRGKSWIDKDGNDERGRKYPKLSMKGERKTVDLKDEATGEEEKKRLRDKPTSQTPPKSQSSQEAKAATIASAGERSAQSPTWTKKLTKSNNEEDLIDDSLPREIGSTLFDEVQNSEEEDHVDELQDEEEEEDLVDEVQHSQEQRDIVSDYSVERNQEDEDEEREFEEDEVSGDISPNEEVSGPHTWTKTKLRNYLKRMGCYSTDELPSSRRELVIYAESLWYSDDEEDDEEKSSSLSNFDDEILFESMLKAFQKQRSKHLTRKQKALTKDFWDLLVEKQLINFD